MQTSDIIRLRLYNQHLLGNTFDEPEKAVEWFGSVQSQEYAHAKWSLSLRIKHAVESKIEWALKAGKILRTHVMRPTWHFVTPKDIRSLLSLTAPRVKTLMTYYNRTLGLDDKIFARCNEIFTKSLQGGKELTRLELSKSLEKSRIKAQGQKLGHIVMQSELDGVLCSGAMRGKQFTYALLEERVPYHKILNRNEALFELAHRYFSSHGPATVNDFAWWSGLTVKDANLGIEMIRSQYTCETVEGKMYWFSQKTSYPKTITTKAFLMSVYDEYIIAYKDRNAIFDLSKSKQKIGNAIFNLVIVLDGKVVGTWKRIFKNNAVEVTIHPFNKLGKNEEDNFRKVADDYGIYLGMPVSFFVSPLTGIES